MMKKGMNVARLNFSHGDHKGHGETYDRIREA
jgi:pyruvate kinase